MNEDKPIRRVYLDDELIVGVFIHIENNGNTYLEFDDGIRIPVVVWNVIATDGVEETRYCTIKNGILNGNSSQ